MKRTILTLLLLLTALCPMAAQQQKTVQRSSIPLAFPEFMEAKVLQPFGRSVKARANIFLKNSALLFVQDGQVMQANIDRVLGVEFDSIKYMKVSSEQMGRVVAQKGYNYLLRVTTIDMDKYSAEVTGGENLPYLDLSDMGMFLEIDSDSQKWEEDYGYPLQNKYYFSIQGKIIPANESNFKKYVKPEMKKAFKRLMNDHYWSWTDEASLMQLFVYLEE